MADRRRHDSSSSSHTVVLVEDDPVLRRGIRRILQRRGYALLEAEDGTEAMQIAQRENGPIGLLLTDLIMPRMGGHELADRFAALHPETVVVIMSGQADEDARAGRVTPRARFLPKPFSPDELLAALEQALSS